ncbi:MAG: helicase-related protein, partial [Verrucomicrobiota bacterium]
MHNLIRAATPELARFLGEKLPGISADWWQKHVVARLSFQQQRVAEERGLSSLQQLDFAALLRVFDQNWYELSDANTLPREGRTWIKELQTIRNKWMHLSAETLPPSETYRDADTLGRLLEFIGATQAALDAVAVSKAAAVAEMAKLPGAATSHPAKTKGDMQPSAPSPKPAAGDTPAVTAPPSLFQLGDIVALRSNPTDSLPVVEVIPGGGERRYRVFQHGIKITYYESQLQAAASVADQRRTIPVDELRACLTSLHILSPSTANLFSLRLGRIQFVPYQYRPVLKLIRSDRPRLLIADEVGVGKTIEAGLIIKELRARINLASVLIICPKALVAEEKWTTEMKRFGERFTALDGPLLRHCVRESHLEGEWPEQYAKAIVPFSLFDSGLLQGIAGSPRDPGLLKLDPPPKFDLVIVDEAHHIRNSRTFLHQGVRYFCDHAQAVLFLSATPVQLGSEDLFTLLNVLRPDLVIDQASFQQMAAPNRHINAAVQHCRAAQPRWQEEARLCLEEVAHTDWGRIFIRESPSFQGIYDRLSAKQLPDVDRVSLTRAIEELYTFSQLINRTRRRDIGEFTTRKADTVTIPFTEKQKSLHDDLLSVIARILEFCHGQQNVGFMMTTIRRQAASCLYGLAPLLQDILAGKLNQLELMQASDRDAGADFSFVEQIRGEIESVIKQAQNLDSKDPKVEAFVKVLADKSKLPNNKALVFSTFRHTLAYLAHHTEAAGLRYGLVHGEVPEEARTELRRRFALPKADAEALDVLLSSEVGCEGLDFQFCDFLVNYDLPWNPMRIEQRIGRIDRYGQKSEAVVIVNFVTPATVDADIYNRCLLRIGVFQHSIGGNEEILGDITRELHDIAESFTLTPEQREAKLCQIADNRIKQIQEEQELESREAELFGLNVPNPSWQQEIAAAESYWLSPQSIYRCVSSYLSTRIGASTEHLLGEKVLKTLRLSQEFRLKLLEDYKQLPRSADFVDREWEKWLKGGQPTLPVTFDQQAAIENPNVLHLSVLHPLVRQAARALQMDSEPAYVSLQVESTALPPGDYRFALYRWRKLGARSDEEIVPVATPAGLEDTLLSLLHTAIDVECSVLPSQAEFDALDLRHHVKWTATQADHIAENRQLVEHRIQSLTVSHQARCRAIQDQVACATNDKIVLMKQSELSRANADFNQRLAELHQFAEGGDIHA